MIRLLMLLVSSVPGIANEPPTSARSELAIRKVRPRLEQKLADLGATWGSALYLRLFKEEKELEVWVQSKDGWKLLDTHPICYFSGALGPKTKEGDLQAPEGFYWVTPNLMNPWSSYHLSFNIGYPNRFDRNHGYTGGLIMIHGNCVSIGCFAMTNPIIEEIYALTDAALRAESKGVPVHIFPFRMTQETAPRIEASPHRAFWQQLKPAYDAFERNQRPPAIQTKGKTYVLKDQN